MGVPAVANAAVLVIVITAQTSAVHIKFIFMISPEHHVQMRVG